MSNGILNELTPEGGWNGPAAPRVRPLEMHELPLPQRLLLEVMLKVGTANCPNVFLTLFRNLRLYLPFSRLTAKMMPQGELTRRQTEIAILRVGWKTRSRYEWGQHIDIGQRIGLTAGDILRVSKGPDAAGWNACEGAIVRAVDELLDNRVIGDTTWQVLSKHFNERLMIELILLIGSYATLAGALNSLGVQLEDDISEIMARTPIHGQA